jgi:threonine aldolase
MTLGERGAQVIVDETAHIVTSEEWGIITICNLVPRLVKSASGVLDPSLVEQTMRDTHARLVCLENSHNNAGGVALTAAQTNAVANLAHRFGASVHLDGARLFNSAVALGVSAKLLVENVDSVAISLNKGLCAPLGALLCGTREMIAAARMNAKRIGAASIHKAGYFAAAGLIALEKMIDGLGEDNRRARILGTKLASLPGLAIDLATVQTNIVFAEITQPGMSSNEFVARLAKQGVLAFARPSNRVRFVTHRMIGDEHVEQAARAVSEIFNQKS